MEGRLPGRRVGRVVVAALVVVTGCGRRTPDAVAQTRDRSAAFLWAVPAGGPGSDDGDGIGRRPQGGAVVSGGFAGTSRFGAAGSITSATPLDDVFAAAYDGGGRALWVRRFGGTGIDHAFDGDVDAAGDSLITGTFANVAAFGPFSLASRGGTQPAYGDAFLLKLDPAGAPRWVRQIGGAGSDGGDEVAAGLGGEAFVVGDSDGDVMFAPRVQPGRDRRARRRGRALSPRRPCRLGPQRSLGGPGLAAEPRCQRRSADRHALVHGRAARRRALRRRRADQRGRRSDVFVAELDRRGRVAGRSASAVPAGPRPAAWTPTPPGTTTSRASSAARSGLGTTTLTSAGGTDLFVAKATSGRPDPMGGPRMERARRARSARRSRSDARGAVLLAGDLRRSGAFGRRDPDSRRPAGGVRRSPGVAADASPGSPARAPAASRRSASVAIAPGRVSVLGRYAGSATLGRFSLPALGRTDIFVAPGRCRPHSEASPCSVATSDRGPPASRCSQR